jgi:hypothetical protein
VPPEGTGSKPGHRASQEATEQDPEQGLVLKGFGCSLQRDDPSCSNGTTKKNAINKGDDPPFKSGMAERKNLQAETDRWKPQQREMKPWGEVSSFWGAPETLVTICQTTQHHIPEDYSLIFTLMRTSDLSMMPGIACKWDVLPAH